MVNIYACCISTFPASLIELLLNSISNKDRILRFHHEKDRIRSLVGELLVRKVISALSNTPNNEIEFIRNEYGKPLLINPSPTIEFNISHAGEWVVLAIDNKHVGIDIEQISSIDLGIAQRYFAQEEFEYIENTGSQELKIEQFYKIWTLKESYIKAAGKGLSISLESFSTIVNKELAVSVRIEGELWYFKTFRHDTSYFLSVCSLSPIMDMDIKIIDVPSLVNTFVT